MNSKRVQEWVKGCFYLLILLGLFGGYYTYKVAAQSTVEPGIDLIILLDQSGSMSTRWMNDAPTDPEGRRVYTARYLVDYMAFDNNFVNPQRTNRVVVIGFGSPDETQLLVNLTPLKTQADIDVAKSQIVDQNLGNTNFISAFQLMRQVFPSGTDAELADGFRRRLVVIITDGGPYDARELDYQQYFEEIQEYYAEEFAGSNYPLYVVGIDDANRYWPDVGDRWKEFSVDAFRVKDVNEVNQQVVAFLCPFLGQTGSGRDCRLQEVGYHFVEPYASTVSFSFFKYREDSSITLRRPGVDTLGSIVITDLLDADLIQYQFGVRDELYVFRNPEPGCWLSERRGEGRVDVFTDMVFNEYLEMTSPVEPHPQVVPLVFTFEIKDEQGQPISEPDAYPITFEAHLTGPDGSHQPMQVQRQQGVDGEYFTSTPPETPMTGTYTLTVQGSVSIPASVCTPGGERQLFSKEFQAEVYAPTLQIVAPFSPQLQYYPVEEWELELVDQRRRVVSAPTTTPWAFDLVVSSPSGVEQVFTQVDWARDRFLVQGPFLLSETGIYTFTLLAHMPLGDTLYQAQTTLEARQNVALLRPSPSYPIKTHVPEIIVGLQDLVGNPVEQDQRYPLRLDATLTHPDGGTETIHLEPAGEPGRYQGVTDWTLDKAALYLLKITAYATLASGVGQPEEVAFVAEHTLNASSELPYFRVLEPAAQGQLAKDNVYSLHGGFRELFQRLPVPIKVEMWRGDEPAPASEMFAGDLKDLFIITVTDANGDVLVEDRPLEKMSEGDGSQFSTELSNLVDEGDYQVQVHLAGTLRNGSDYENIIPDIVVSFHLQETNLYRTVRVFMFILAAIVLLVVMLLLARFVWNSSPPYPKGKLIVKERGASLSAPVLHEFNLVKRKKTMVFKGQEVPGVLQLKRIEVRRITAQRRGKQKEEGVEIKAFDRNKKQVVKGKLYSSQKGKYVACTQKTTHDKSYGFWYSES